MQMPGRDTTIKGSYRFGFNGKEIDNEPYGQGNEYDYGFRIYNPRIGKFLSVDPLTKSYPMLSPFQFASNSPVANMDLDGGESKYFNEYSTTISTITPSGAQTQITISHASEDLKREPLFFSDKLGSGTLYTFYKRSVEQHWDSKQNKIIITKDVTTQVGSMYVEPVPAPRHQNPFSVNIQIWGSGIDPQEAYGDKPNPNAKIYTMNFKQFTEMMEPVLVGIDVKSPSELKPPTITEMEEHFADYLIGKAIDKLNEKWGNATPSETPDPNSYLPNQQYIIDDPSADLPAGRGYSGKVLRKSVRTDSSGKVKDTIIEYNRLYSYPEVPYQNDTTPTKKQTQNQQ